MDALNDVEQKKNKMQDESFSLLCMTGLAYYNKD